MSKNQTQSVRAAVDAMVLGDAITQFLHGDGRPLEVYASAKGLSSRAIIGSFFLALQMDVGASWIPRVSMMFNSDQESEEYKWLGMVPAMREWIGGRQAKGFHENGLTIKNKHFEATLEVLVKDMRRDKTGQVMTRIRELAQRTNSHWMSLLSTLVILGDSSVCYDGQFFFDTDHIDYPNAPSGTQSNKISASIADQPVTTHGTPTNPSVGDMQFIIIEGIKQIVGFVDDENEPMNELATQFLVMTPLNLWKSAVSAVSQTRQITDDQSQIVYEGYDISVASNVRLDKAGWDDKFVVFRTDSNVSALIRQQETEVGTLKAKAEGSEFEFDNDAHQYGVDVWRNVGYGYWQMACEVTIVA